MSNKLKKLLLPAFILAFFISLLFGVSLSSKYVYAEAQIPDTSNMVNIINANSVGKKTWGNGTFNYSFDSQEGSTFYFTNPNLVGMAKISYGGVCLSKTILSCTAIIPTSGTDDWSWNYIIIRGDASLDNFTAFAFRRGGGHMMLLSRVNGVWYTYDDSAAGGIIAGIPTIKNCELGSSTVLSGLIGNEIDLLIETTSNYVKVYSGNTLIYESTLTLDLPLATGIFYYSAASGNQNLILSNVKCFTPNITTLNNAINEQNIIYSPYGGGGAECSFTNDGATIKAGSSVNGTALLTTPYIDGRTISTYSFTLDTATENLLSFYSIVLRASDDMEEYLVFQIRRAFGQCMMFGKLNGYNCSYAINEPFESKNIPIFPIKRLNNGQTISEGTRIDLTIISDDEGVTIYNKSEEIYSIKYSNLALTDKNANTHDLDFSKIPEYVTNLAPRVGIFGGGDYGYINAEFFNVNCYYEGEIIEDVQRNTFLNNLSYKSNQIEGFSQGTFEYDYIVSKSNTVDHESLQWENGSGVEKVDIDWDYDEDTGFEQAILTLTTATVKRKYIITFVKYDAPTPFVREKWDINATDNNSSETGCTSTLQIGGVFSCILIFCAFTIIFSNRKKRGKNND